MATTTVSPGQYPARRPFVGSANMSAGRLGLGTVGVVTILAAAWGGLVAFIGPTFGFSGDGTGSWHWSLTHAVVGLIPGAVAVIMGFVILGETRSVPFGRGRVGLATAGTIAGLCGAWLTVGPFAWPVADNTGSYFVVASPLRGLAYLIGYALGPGLIVTAGGAFALGWASRHQATSIQVLADPLPVQTVSPGSTAEPPTGTPLADPAAGAYGANHAEPTSSDPVVPVQEHAGEAHTIGEPASQVPPVRTDQAGEEYYPDAP